MPREASELVTRSLTQAFSQQEEREAQGQKEGLTRRPESSLEGTAFHIHAIGRCGDRNSFLGWPRTRGSGEGGLDGTAAHRLLPPPPPPPWPPASGAPDIMRNSTTGMMYIQYLAKKDFCS